MQAYADGPAQRSPYAPQDRNWRAHCKALTAGTDPSVVLDSGLIAVEYYDGLGRNVQVQSFGSGHGGFSAGSVDARTFDWRDRVVEELLPAPVAVPGDFVGRQDLCALMQEPQACYSTTSYEASTFGRPVRVSRPGANRKRAGRAVQTTYTHNSTTKGSVLYCPHLILQDNKIKDGKPWQAGDLAVSVVVDEDGESRYSFTDMRGRTILERRVSSNVRREDTMYIYDHAGRLLHILPPAMSAKVANGETIDLTKEDAGRLFSYRYDSRERPVEVQMPASGRVRTAFTPHSRQALWQDAVLSLQSRVLRTTYDNRLRRAYVSLHGAPDSLFHALAVTSSVHYLGQAFKAHFGYTMPAGIKNANEEQILSVDYYDDYSFLGIYPEVADSLDWRAVPGCDTRASGAKHRLTGTARRIIGPTGITGKMQVTAYYYDEKGHLVQTVSTNIAGGFDRIALALSFDGRVTRSTHIHTARGNVTIRRREFVYDGQARLTQVRMKTNDKPWVTLTDTEYDPRGWMLKQRLLDDAVQVDYEYNDAGELTSITSAPFTQHLYRDEPAGEGGLAGRIPLYNGRVSGETFSLSKTGGLTNVNSGMQSLNAGYAYRYDGLRLVSAAYNEFSRNVTLPIGKRGGNIYTDPDYSVSISYNADGLPSGIKRHGLVDTSEATNMPVGGGFPLQGSYMEYKYGLVDDLALQYKAVKLDRVDDRADTDCALSIGTDFNEAAQRDGEYEYDACGRMTRDRNKGVSIAYNILGLPSSISYGAGAIRYTYNSDGELLRTEYGTITIVVPDPAYGGLSPVRPAFNLTGERLKCGEVEYVDGEIERIWNEAGWGGQQGSYVAAVRDCRGSLRATYSQPVQAAPPALTATPLTKVYGNLTAYYPGGLPFADWQGTDRYLFSGKELERDAGLLTYDFHARRYDPQTLLFQQPDPCADSYPGLPTYLYCAANPVSLTDPSGCIISIKLLQGKFNWQEFPDSQDGKWGFVLVEPNKDYYDGKLKGDSKQQIEFITKALQDIMDSGTTGYKLVHQIATDSREMLITLSGRSCALVDINIVRWNHEKDLEKQMVLTTDGIDCNPTINLAHELAHIQYTWSGHKKSFWYYVQSGNEEKKVDKSEIFTTFIENKIRVDMGCPLRKCYDIQLVDGMPICGRKLIDKQRKSLYVDQNEKVYYDGLPKGVPGYEFIKH